MNNFKLKLKLLNPNPQREDKVLLNFPQRCLQGHDTALWRDGLGNGCCGGAGGGLEGGEVRAGAGARVLHVLVAGSALDRSSWGELVDEGDRAKPLKDLIKPISSSGSDQ